MKIFDTTQSLQQELSRVNRDQIGFVPTMGALHAGHISLVQRARKTMSIVVVSIFVNPTQFNDKRDLECYPRTLQADVDLLAAAGVDYIFTPSVEDIYPTPDTRVFDFGTVDKTMEGLSRPGHFNGVAQVVSRLFDIVNPKAAFFGEKDFQQIAIIREMVRQLNYDIEIVDCPIIRAEDGLALSSRNTLLTAECREAAPTIYSALRAGVALSQSASPAEVTEAVISHINSNEHLEVVYFKIVDSLTMQDITSWDDAQAIQGCITVQAANVRLIDNIKFR